MSELQRGESYVNSRATAFKSGKQKMENRADRWAIRKLIPREEFLSAVAEGCTTVWQLAERFNVTEEFMKKAMCYYTHGNLAYQLYS